MDALEDTLEIVVERVSANEDFPGVTVDTDEGEHYDIGDGATAIKGGRDAVIGWLARGLTDGLRYDGELPERPARSVGGARPARRSHDGDEFGCARCPSNRAARTAVSAPLSANATVPAKSSTSSSGTVVVMCRCLLPACPGGQQQAHPTGGSVGAMPCWR